MTIGRTHRSLRGAVLDELRQLIVTGELEPGSRLVEEALAVRLEVSRNPVREALQTLAAEGFVEMVPRRGAVVSCLSPQEVEELFEVRLALESLAARRAARHADEAAVLALAQVLEQARVATADQELDRLAELNTRFHQLVVTAGGSSYLEMLVAPIAQRVQWVFRRSAHSRATGSWGEHAQMLEAIVTGDEESAAVLAAAHVVAARTSYRLLVAAEAADPDAGEDATVTMDVPETPDVPGPPPTPGETVRGDNFAAG